MKINENQIATVWELEEMKGKKIIRAKVSTYEGKNQNDESVYSSWFAKFVGDAFKPARKLNKGDRIELTEAKIENFYNKETGKAYVFITIFDFKEAEEPKRKSKKK